MLANPVPALSRRSTCPDRPRHRPYENVRHRSPHHQPAQEIQREKHDSGDHQQPEPPQPFQPPVPFLLGHGPPRSLDAGPIRSGPPAVLVPSAVAVSTFPVSVVAPIPVIGRFSLVGLSREVESLRVAPSTACAVIEVKTAAAGETTAAKRCALSHHREEDGVDIHAAAKHVRGVGQVHAAVVALALPARVCQ